jgi:hypothetical protein
MTDVKYFGHIPGNCCWLRTLPIRALHLAPVWRLQKLKVVDVAMPKQQDISIQMGGPKGVEHKRFGHTKWSHYIYIYSSKRDTPNSFLASMWERFERHLKSEVLRGASGRHLKVRSRSLQFVQLQSEVLIVRNPHPSLYLNATPPPPVNPPHPLYSQMPPPSLAGL